MQAHFGYGGYGGYGGKGGMPVMHGPATRPFVWPSRASRASAAQGMATIEVCPQAHTGRSPLLQAKVQSRRDGQVS